MRSYLYLTILKVMLSLCYILQRWGYKDKVVMWSWRLYWPGLAQEKQLLTPCIGISQKRHSSSASKTGSSTGSFKGRVKQAMKFKTFKLYYDSSFYQDWYNTNIVDVSPMPCFHTGNSSWDGFKRIRGRPRCFKASYIPQSQATEICILAIEKMLLHTQRPKSVF